MVLKSPKGANFEHCLRLNFSTKNNKAKYKATKLSLRDLGLLASYRFSSSIFLVIQSWWSTRSLENSKLGSKMDRYLEIAKTLLIEFRVVQIEQMGGS